MKVTQRARREQSTRETILLPFDSTKAYMHTSQCRSMPVHRIRGPLYVCCLYSELAWNPCGVLPMLSWSDFEGSKGPVPVCIHCQDTQHCDDVASGCHCRPALASSGPLIQLVRIRSMCHFLGIPSCGQEFIHTELVHVCEAAPQLSRTHLSLVGDQAKLTTTARVCLKSSSRRRRHP